MTDPQKLGPVPCAGCTACCTGEAIVLMPEYGDDPLSYETTADIDPATGNLMLMIRQQDNGDCHYLGEAGCTIYERRPAICRNFDCRGSVLMLGDAADLMVKAGIASKEVVARGRELLARIKPMLDKGRAGKRAKRLARPEPNARGRSA